MRKQVLFKLPIGIYELTDDIYNYTMDIDIIDDSKIYFITEKGNIGKYYIALHEDFIDEGYFKRKILTASSGIGGLCVHSDDTWSLLRKLKFAPRGSFKQFVEKTKHL